MRPLPIDHPGSILLHAYLLPRGIKQAALARATGIPSRHISAIIQGRHPITTDIALRLSAHLGTPARYWMDLQWDYEQAVRTAVATENAEPQPVGQTMKR